MNKENCVQAIPEVSFPAIGARIRVLRRERKLTQAALGWAVGLSTSFVGHVERGTRIPGVETLVRIAAVLGVTVDALVTGGTAVAVNQAGKMRMLNDIMRVLYEHAGEWMEG